MIEREIVTSLDLGSTRFRAVVGWSDPNGECELPVHVSCAAAGMRHGAPIDLPAASEALRGLIDEAYDRARIDESRVVVAVGGDEIRSLNSQAVLSLESVGTKVRESHVRELNRRVRAIDVPYDRTILHCLPIDYSVDDRSGLDTPLELVGTRVTLDAHVVTGSQAHVGAIRRVAELAGLEVADQVFSGCAAGIHLVSDADRSAGALLIDIGAESTQFALYCRGRLRRTGAVPVGAAHVTRDLAWGMELDERSAERIKRRYGSALRTMPALVATDDALAPTPESLARIAAICEARQQEILELVAQALQWGINRPVLAGGILLTGGGSRLRGSAELAEQVFGVRSACRRASNDDAGCEPESWAVALGAAQFVLAREPEMELESAEGDRNKIWRPLQRWIGRLV